MTEVSLIDVSVIPEGSVVAVRIGEGVKLKRMRQIADQLVRAGKRRGLSFILTTPEIQLTAITDEQLATAGLQRIPGKRAVS